MNSSVHATTTIEWWQFWTDPAIKPTIEAMVSEFEQANPDIKVNLTDLTWANGHEKIVISLASGTGPDVVELGSDWIAQFANNDQLLDISNDVVSDSSDSQGWTMATYRGKVYASPWILGTRVLFANRNLLLRAGYDESFVPITWGQFFEAAMKVNALGKDVYGWGSNIAEKHRLYKKFLPFFWSVGGRIFSEDNQYCLMASDQAVSSLSFYRDLHDSCGYVANQRGIEDAFLEGKIGFIMSGDWLLKRIQLENREINLLSTLIPGPKFPGRSFMGGEFLAINAASDHKDAARKFIKWITNAENQIRFCRANLSANPSNRQAQQDSYFTNNDHLMTFIRAIQSAKHPPVDPHWIEIESIIEDAVEKTLFGDDELVAEHLLSARYKIEDIDRQ
ncbi:MAG: extracellular solute-binding protein [Candidatus Zixiibacteriota bacterium]